MSTNIVLIGMPAVGKSTYGKLLAQAFSLDFVDTDDVIEQLAQQSCAVIIAEQGLETFAAYESQALSQLLNADVQNTVISTGGSAIYRQELSSFKSSSLFVHLSASRKTLAARIENAAERGIVMDANMTFSELYKQRLPLYKTLADVQFVTDSNRGSEQQLAEQLIAEVAQWRQQQQLDQQWMAHALTLAEHAAEQGEVPVGAVVVSNGEIIGEGWNQVIALHDPTAHAEVQAVRAACAKTGNYRLSNATLYVTLEPCAMCAGTLVHARVKRVVFAATDPRAGAAGSVLSVLDNPQLNHRCQVESGLQAEKAAALLTDFFQSKRK